MKKTLCVLALFGFTTLGCNQQAPTRTSQAQPASSVADVATVAAKPDTSPPAGRLIQADAKTATLKAKFVYDGKAPAPAKVDGSKDPFCGTVEIVSQAMVVGKDGELQNLALILDTRRTDAEIPEAMLKAPAETVVLDNKGCIFEPHVFFARPGQTVEVTNSDETGHNANFNFFNNTPVNFLVPAGGKKDLKLTTEEPAPIPVECNVHPWMKSFIIVQEHPFVGISNEAGEITIENLPVGSVTFKVWHENAEKSIDEAMMGGEKQKWSRGRMEIELKAGVNDLGTIKIAPEMFKS